MALRDRLDHGVAPAPCACVHMHILADHVTLASQRNSSLSCVAASLAMAPKKRCLE